MANEVIPVIAKVEVKNLIHSSDPTLSKVALNIHIRVSDIFPQSNDSDIVTVEALLDKAAYRGLLLGLRTSGLELFWSHP